MGGPMWFKGNITQIHFDGSLDIILCTEGDRDATFRIKKGHWGSDQSQQLQARKAKDKSRQSSRGGNRKKKGKGKKKKGKPTKQRVVLPPPIGQQDHDQLSDNNDDKSMEDLLNRLDGEGNEAPPPPNPVVSTSGLRRLEVEGWDDDIRQSVPVEEEDETNMEEMIVCNIFDNVLRGYSEKMDRTSYNHIEGLVSVPIKVLVDSFKDPNLNDLIKQSSYLPFIIKHKALLLSLTKLDTVEKGSISKLEFVEWYLGVHDIVVLNGLV